MSVLTPQHVAQAFGTPVSTYLWPDSEQMNAELHKGLLALEASDEGIHHSNIGGWHSKTDLLSHTEIDGIPTLSERIVSMVGDMARFHAREDVTKEFKMRVDCWANISRSGNYANIHDHGGAVWSGVYYVSSGQPRTDDPANGKLELIDPRTGIAMVGAEYGTRSGRFLVDPMPGLMIVFPSWLKHMVHPFVGTGERISIAFNVNIIPAR